MFLITAAKAVVMVGLVGRLISLQINQATKYKSLSDKNRFREWKLAPERGAIVPHEEVVGRRQSRQFVAGNVRRLDIQPQWRRRAGHQASDSGWLHRSFCSAEGPHELHIGEQVRKDIR